MSTGGKSSHAPLDGVIKFELTHLPGELPGHADATAIHHWFAICRALNLIGRDPLRYEGAAYGNISQRFEHGFLVTGTQTGGRDALTLDDIGWVSACDIASNRVSSQGPARPSSESLTHAQVYRELPEINFVIHVHSPRIWQRGATLDLPSTPPQAAYGTPEMAQEVQRLLQEKACREQGVFSMGGHEDGIVVFAETPAIAGLRLLRLYRRACELNG